MRLRKTSRPGFLIVAVGSWLAAVAVAALPEDYRQPINISSDRASYEGSLGVYQGDVVLEQGSLTILADKLVIHELNKKVERIIAYGEPAQMEQQATAEREHVEAMANVIEYFVQDARIVLLGAARVNHNGSEITGERIVYNNQNQAVTAAGGETTGSGRVNMILQPSDIERLKENNRNNADTESD